MIEKTILRIEERLRAAESLSPAQREELEQLLVQLRDEARTFPADRLPAEVSSDDEDDARNAISRLEESLASFETSHPRLTGVVNRISTMLANMGI